MEIIKAKKEDIDILLKIRLEMLKIVNNLPEDYVYSPDFVENCRENFLEGNQTDLLCMENGEAVGCATLCYISMMPTFSHPTGNRSHLMNVYVREDFRGQGLAKKMLSMLIQEAKSRGVTEISLDATEMGRPLYEVMGFVQNDSAMIINLK